MFLSPSQMPFDDDLFEKNQDGELTIKPGSINQSLIEGGGGLVYSKTESFPSSNNISGSASFSIAPVGIGQELIFHGVISVAGSNYPSVSGVFGLSGGGSLTVSGFSTEYDTSTGDISISTGNSNSFSLSLTNTDYGYKTTDVFIRLVRMTANSFVAQYEVLGQGSSNAHKKLSSFVRIYAPTPTDNVTIGLSATSGTSNWLNGPSFLGTVIVKA